MLLVLRSKWGRGSWGKNGLVVSCRRWVGFIGTFVEVVDLTLVSRGVGVQGLFVKSPRGGVFISASLG